MRLLPLRQDISRSTRCAWTTDQTTSGRDVISTTSWWPAVQATNNGDIRTSLGVKRLLAHPSLLPTSPQSATAPFRLAFRCRVATADQKLREIGSDFVGGVENVTCRRRKLITVRDTGGIGCGEEENCPRGGLIVAVAHEDEAKRYLLSNGVYSTP